MRWVGHVVCMRDKRDAYKMFVGEQKGNKLLEDLAVNGRILKWILQK
jgi:hypothetical protein